MGLFDDIFNDAQDYAETVDPSAEKMPKGFGFDPEACRGCPERMENTSGKPCNLCGCPTVPGLFMDLRQQPPADCLRLDEHESR